MQAELCVATMFVAVAAMIDVRSRRIPNWLTLTCFLTGVACHAQSFPTLGMWPLLMALEGAALALSILVALWLTNGAGAGDAKLGAAIGVWISTRDVLYVLLISISICLIWRRLAPHPVRSVPQTFPASVAQVTDEVTQTYKIPFAVPMTVAMLMLLAWNGI